MLDLCDHGDPRKWTQQHLDAADLRIACIAPTPPQGEIENDCMDVNVRGPGMYMLGDLSVFFPRKLKLELSLIIPLFHSQMVSLH